MDASSFVKVVTIIWCISSTSSVATAAPVIAGTSIVDNEEVESMATCNPKNESNFYAIRSILDNEVRSNNTLLRQLAGIFSDETHQLNQVIVRYELCIQRNEDNCTFNIADCNYAKFSNQLNDSDYYCITTDPFTWSPYSTTAHDLILRDLDACPLVIGPYQQEELTIYFNITTPPSCNNSLFDNDTIQNKKFPCGWQCELDLKKWRRDFALAGTKRAHPRNLFFDDPLYDESHIDRVLLRITSKLLQYATKENLPDFSYDPTKYLGYAAKYDSSRYFHPAAEYAEYGVFLFAYLLLHVLLMFLICERASSYYGKKAHTKTNGDKHYDKILFASFIVTSVSISSTLLLTSLGEGGVCITVMQMWVIGISLAPALIYMPLSAYYNIKKCLNERRCCCYFLIFFVCIHIFIFPHVILMLILLTVVSFIYNPSGTSILIIYFCSSSMVLWIANAIAIHLCFSNFILKIHEKRTALGPADNIAKTIDVSRAVLNNGIRKGGKNIERIQICNDLNACKATCKPIGFAISLFLSFNLMNLSLMPFIGDYYYDRRPNISVIFSILIPMVITVVGWYFSSKLVNQNHDWIINHRDDAKGLARQIGEILYHASDLFRRIQYKKRAKKYKITDGSTQQSFIIKVEKEPFMHDE